MVDMTEVGSSDQLRGKNHQTFQLTLHKFGSFISQEWTYFKIVVIKYSQIDLLLGVPVNITEVWPVDGLDRESAL